MRRQGSSSRKRTVPSKTPPLSTWLFPQTKRRVRLTKTSRAPHGHLMPHRRGSTVLIASPLRFLSPARGCSGLTLLPGACPASHPNAERNRQPGPAAPEIVDRECSDSSRSLPCTTTVHPPVDTEARQEEPSGGNSSCRNVDHPANTEPEIA